MRHGDGHAEQRMGVHGTERAQRRESRVRVGEEERVARIERMQQNLPVAPAADIPPPREKLSRGR
ncbi:hypothetical protein GCM10010464_17670 [Pseudonocardia yunnanensis]